MSYVYDGNEGQENEVEIKGIDGRKGGRKDEWNDARIVEYLPRLKNILM